MKLRIFALFLLLGLNFSTILTANASKYYYESYEQSEMYADAITNDQDINYSSSSTSNNSDTNNILEINSVSKPTTSASGQSDSNVANYNANDNLSDSSEKLIKVGESETIRTEKNGQQIRQVVRIYKKDKKTSSNGTTASSVKTKTSNKTSTTEANASSKKRTKKTKYQNARLGLRAFVGASGVLLGNYQMNTGDVSKSNLPYTVNASVGAKFYIFKKRTGLFVGADLFFKLFQAFSFNSIFYNTITVNSASTGMGNSNFEYRNYEYTSVYENVFKNMFGFSFNVGFSISRFSFYGKFNLGVLQISNSVSITSDSVTKIAADIKAYTDANNSNDATIIRENANVLLNRETSLKNSTLLGFGLGIDVNVTQKIFIRLEYEHWIFKNSWTTDNYTQYGTYNKDGYTGSKKFSSNGNFGVVTLGIGFRFIGISF